MTFYIDSKEPHDVQITVETTIKDRQPSVEVETKGLKTGDFVYKNTVIERKEASDLASSIKDGRLKDQSIRMTEDFDHQYLIVEGDPYTLEYSNLHNNSFIGTMVSRSHDGIKIIYTPDQKGTAYALNKIISKHEEGEEKTERLSTTKAEAEDVQVAMLTCVEGVSKEKARKILEKNDWEILVRDIVDDATRHMVKKDLQNIKGIGEKTATKIVRTFT